MWENKKLKEIADWGSGGTPKSTNPEFYDGNIPWLIIGDLNDGFVTDSEKKITKEGLKNSSAKMVAPDSILIAMYGSIGKLGINKIEVATNQAIAFTKSISEEVYNIYLFYYLLSKRRDLHGLGKGGTQQNISQTVLKEVEIPVPPLLTQHRIVEKIEELFSELDNGVENLKKAQKQLKTYRQAVLKDAFEGKLTKDWRERQSDLPSPDELLQQIKAERKDHRKRELADWEKEVEQWEKDGKTGRKPPKPRKVKDVDPISEKVQNELSELPENWQWIKLGQIIDQPKYGTSEKCDYDFEGYGVLRIPNIGKGVIDSEDMKYAPLEDNEASKYALQKGDILTIRSNGSIDLVGKCALIREPDTEFLHAGYLIRLRPYNKIANSRFLLNVISSVSLRNQIESKAKSTSGVNNINSGELQDLIIPICGIEEQQEIVNEIESRLSVVDQLEQTIKENLQKAEALRQSILKKAFGGELIN